MADDMAEGPRMCPVLPSAAKCCPVLFTAAAAGAIITIDQAIEAESYLEAPRLLILRKTPVLKG